MANKKGRNKGKGKGKAIATRRKPPAAAVAQSQSDSLNRRLTQVRPRGAAGEMVEDVAIFDAEVRKSLSEESAALATIVAEAFQAIQAGRDDDALKILAGVPRTSPFSQWRLFAKGLIDWYGDQVADAIEAWRRLEPSRRPARIASSLLASRRVDLGKIQPLPTGTLANSAEHNAAPEGISIDPDTAALQREPGLLAAAKLVRRVRVERPALVEAERETRKLESLKDCRIGIEKLRWLQRFSSEFNRHEAALVKSLQHAALRRSFSQPFADAFDLATKTIPGPPHDPCHSLLRFHYLGFFRGAESDAAESLKKYMDIDLPTCKSLSPNLRQATISECHRLQAVRQLEAGNTGDNPFSFFRRSMPDNTKIQASFDKAIKALPANAKAHEEYVKWLRDQINNDRRPAKERKPFESRLPLVMQSWSDGSPDDIEPRLWLVDHYLENEELEAAKPHVLWLKSSRHEDPRVRATPWKWHLLESMRMMRRKVWLADGKLQLNEAATLWPSWLSNDWLTYLYAAIAFRQGDTDGFAKCRADIRKQHPGRTDFVDDVMMLAAGQQMKLPAESLKTLRQPVDQAVIRRSSLTTDELIDAGAFFWDLHRASLLYPAYRMHGSKFAHELDRRLDALKAPPQHPHFTAALYWTSAHATFMELGQISYPKWFASELNSNVTYAAAVLNAVKGRDFKWALEGIVLQPLGVVRDGAMQASDSFYRFWFANLVKEVEDELQEVRSRSRGMGAFANMFNNDDESDDDEDWDDDDEDDEEEELCYCPKCTADRARAAAAGFADDPDADDTDDVDTGELFRTLEASMAGGKNLDPDKLFDLVDMFVNVGNSAAATGNPGPAKKRPKYPPGSKKRKGNR